MYWIIFLQPRWRVCCREERWSQWESTDSWNPLRNDEGVFMSCHSHNFLFLPVVFLNSYKMAHTSKSFSFCFVLLSVVIQVFPISSKDDSTWLHWVFLFLIVMNQEQMKNCIWNLETQQKKIRGKKGRGIIFLLFSIRICTNCLHFPQNYYGWIFLTTFVPILAWDRTT